MCGIVGYLGRGEALEVLLEGLKRLEYRGYDSAGVALIQQGRLQVVKSVGKIRDLERSLKPYLGLSSHLGIGHTRWATHGRPSEANAHPQKAGHIAVVHNGIIENYLELKEELVAQGHQFVSETDSEVIAQLLLHEYEGDLFEAVSRALGRLKGAYAIAVISEMEPHRIVGARRDSPLVLGLGDDGCLLASDIPAISPFTRKVVSLENGDKVLITPEGMVVIDERDRQVERAARDIPWSVVMAEKAGYKHFMQKEIFEQPRAVADTMRGYFSVEKGEVYFPDAGLSDLSGLRRVVLVACGTSWHAALVGKLWMESIARVPVDVEIASEFRYRGPVLDEGTLAAFISQSGETADTLAALRMAKEKGARTLAICNVIGSSIPREAHGVIYTHAGPEIGVASTKAFTSQLVILYLLSLYFGLKMDGVGREQVKERLNCLLGVPGLMEKVLLEEEYIEQMGRRLFQVKGFLYLGRWLSYPIALEGALKLKEISYIHAEGYPAGEMKHGPIALIDEDLPVVVLAPKDRVYEKVLSNIEEVKSRDGLVIAVGERGDRTLIERVDRFISVPAVEEEFTPFLTVLPLQLLAYYIADRKGCDIDQPRNLAKSVTVE